MRRREEKGRGFHSVAKGVLCAVAACVASGVAMGKDPGDRNLQFIVIPPATDIEIDRVHRPVYPRAAAIQDVEGLVKVSFTVNEEGGVNNASIYEVPTDSRAHRKMGESAIKAIERWRFKPATVNDSPVSREAVQTVTFSLSTGGAKPDVDGVRLSFGFDYKANEALQALSNNDFDGAEDAIAVIDRHKMKTLGDFAYQDLIKAMYWLGMENYALAREHADRARFHFASVGPNPAYHQILRVSFLLDAQEQRLNSALEHVESLQASDQELADDDPIFAQAAGVRAALESDRTIVSEGVIASCWLCEDDATRFSRPLNRARFYLEAKPGAIETVRVSCGASGVSLDWATDVAWQIDHEPESCEVRVNGTPGETVRIIQLPVETA